MAGDGKEASSQNSFNLSLQQRLRLRFLW